MNFLLSVSIGLSLTGALALKLNAPSELFDAPLPTHILLFNYGKVASTSMQISFGKLSGSYPEYVTELRKTYPPRCKIHDFNIARDYIEKLPNGSNAWVITAIRNRFNRDIAAYFQRFRHNVEFENKMRNKTVPELQEDFQGERLDYADDWFQRDFFNATNVNLLTYAEQAKKNKYVHVKRGPEDKRLQILLVRFEDIGHWDKIFGAFFPGFTLAKSNPITSEYEDKYIEFLNTYVPSEQEINGTCHGDSMHFYSPLVVSAIAPQCSGQAVQFRGASAQKRQNYAYAADTTLLQYDADLDLLDED